MSSGILEASSTIIQALMKTDGRKEAKNTGSTNHYNPSIDENGDSRKEAKNTGSTNQYNPSIDENGDSRKEAKILEASSTIIQALMKTDGRKEAKILEAPTSIIQALTKTVTAEKKQKYWKHHPL